MQLAPRRRPPPEVPAVAATHPSLLVPFVEALASGEVAPSLYLVSGLRTDEIEAATRPASDDGVVLDLCGLTAPAHVEAVGVVSGGTAHHLDDPEAAPRRVGVVCFVDRDGATVTAVTPDGEVRVTGADEPGPVGHLADVCRRVLGLATPPPEVGVDELAVALWADRVLAAALVDDRLDRRRITAMRPGPVRSWAEVRRARAAGAWGELDVEPEVAGWMDDGAFARWVLAALPDPVDVVLDLVDVVADDALAPLASVVYWSASRSHLPGASR